MKKTDLAYFAGLFDGEGTIFITNNLRKGRKNLYKQLTVAITMTNQWIIELFHFAFGGCLQFIPAHANKKSAWYLSLRSRIASDFLKVILPYLKLKKAEAEIAIRFQDEKDRRRKENRIGRGRSLTEGEIAIEEAQRIMLKKLKE